VSTGSQDYQSQIDKLRSADATKGRRSLVRGQTDRSYVD
jgi:hypothetical protein